LGDKDVIKTMNLQKERECTAYNGHDCLVGYNIKICYNMTDSIIHHS